MNLLFVTAGALAALSLPVLLYLYQESREARAFTEELSRLSQEAPELIVTGPEELDERLVSEAAASIR